MRSINNKPGLFTGLAPNMLLDITWTNDDPVHRRIYVSLGLSELKEVINCRFITQYITTILVCQGQYTSRWHDCFHVPRQVWHIRNESIKSYQLQSKVPKYPLSNLNNVLKFIDLLVCYLLKCTQIYFTQREKERKSERRVRGERQRGMRWRERGREGHTHWQRKTTENRRQLTVTNCDPVLTIMLINEWISLGIQGKYRPMLLLLLFFFLNVGQFSQLMDTWMCCQLRTTSWIASPDHGGKDRFMATSIPIQSRGSESDTLVGSHYCDVKMGAVASQITRLTIVYSTVYSDADQRKRQSSASLAFVRGFHRGPVNSPHKWPVTRKMFPFDDVIMRNGRPDVYVCAYTVSPIRFPA